MKHLIKALFISVCLLFQSHWIVVVQANPVFIKTNSPILQNLIRGAVLKVASDITGGTPLENIKCRVTTSNKNPVQCTRDIVSQPGGILNLWSGTRSRTMEGAVQGAIFLCASVATKRYVFAMGGSNNAAAFVAGVVGGVAQAVILTPSTMAFTSLNVNKHKPGYENDNEFTVAKRIYKEKGLGGLFVGADAMAARQASTWASRTLFTELCRTNLQLVSKYGLLGEVASGIIGGLGSCWNTPIETVRVLMHRDMSCGHPTKSFMGYIQQEMDAGGIPALFRGVSPRALQAIWQTVFMVVVPNVLGI